MSGGASSDMSGVSGPASVMGASWVHWADVVRPQRSAAQLATAALGATPVLVFVTKRTNLVDVAAVMGAYGARRTTVATAL